MPQHQSAMKQLRKSEKHHVLNRKVQSSLRTAVKKIETTVSLKDSEKAKTILAETVPVLNRAASRGYIHKNKAARLVSRLTKKVNRMSVTA